MVATETRATIDVELATTPAVFEDACRLVHDEYVARGYMAPHPSGTRIGWHQSLPSTRVFVARHAGRVIATISLVPDSVHGMPCDALYPWELAAMRARGERIGEVAAFAIDARYRGAGGHTVRALLEAVGVHAVRRAALTTLCITVNPRHTRFYETRLGFERFGAIKPCGAVNGAPAVPLRLALARVRLKSLHFARAMNDSPARSGTEVC
ncbi:MAG: hypothetical protein HYR51_03470 [Candidatus Rokubacteria bacterium]|nr:hypothetical protein [Candidatus Rokubacteria bacterium]